MNYYNEHDPKAAAWLRELIAQNLIPEGVVDERSIEDVRPSELLQYIQCHFFAGIGGWSYALQLAGWPSDRPVWTGSCPCQPFSTAGKGLAQADERHLWPVFFDLIRQCRPEHVFGEQVASAIGHGWLDGVSADLEAEGYACGAIVLGAHSVNSPHQRQRLYWVAKSNNFQCSQLSNTKCQGSKQRPANGSSVSRMGDSVPLGREGFGNFPSREQAVESKPRFKSRPGRLVLPDSDRCSAGSHAATPAGYGNPSDAAGFWSDFQLVHCRDGKTRRIPTEPAFFPLAHGVSARVVRLRGYGNAIVPQVAAEFIKAYTEAICID